MHCVYFRYFYDSKYSVIVPKCRGRGARSYALLRKERGERLILDRIRLGNDRIPYRRSNISVPVIPRIPSSRYVRDIYAASRRWRKGGRKRGGKGGKGARWKGASITRPFHKGSRRQDESSKRHDAGTKQGTSRQCSFPDHAPDAFAYLVSMGALLGSTVIQRRGSLLMRIPTTGRKPAQSWEQKMEIFFIKKC